MSHKLRESLVLISPSKRFDDKIIMPKVICKGWGRGGEIGMLGKVVVVEDDAIKLSTEALRASILSLTRDNHRKRKGEEGREGREGEGEGGRREREREREGGGGRETETETDRQRQRDTDIETERERKKEREREREKGVHILPKNISHC